jgi:hypothetical protein
MYAFNMAFLYELYYLLWYFSEAEKVKLQAWWEGLNDAENVRIYHQGMSLPQKNCKY